MSQEVKMKEKFEIIDFFDRARWQSDGDHSLINYAYPNNKDDCELACDEKLLTHWLSYIMDRQMSFEQIWDKGGFIISEIVHKYTHEQNMDFLKGLNEFFVKTGDLGYTFTSKNEYGDFSDTQKDRIKLYYKKEILKADFKITFKSRFYTDDFVCILHTLYTLKEFNCSFVEYLACIIKKVNALNGVDKVKYSVLGMAYALNLLTYDIKFSEGGKRISYKNDADKVMNIETYLTEKFNRDATTRTKHILELIKNIQPEELRKNIDKFYETDDRFISMKRTWCSLRDYIKSKEYGEMFCAELRDKCEGCQELINAIFNSENNYKTACQWIELPGDVWNENSIFRQCITVQTTGKLGIVLRNEYEEISDCNGYPEEFDTTFNFVPRMCEKGNCKICPFAKLKEIDIDKNRIEKMCTNNTECFCPLMIKYCGYEFKCIGRDNCILCKHFDI